MLLAVLLTAKLAAGVLVQKLVSAEEQMLKPDMKIDVWVLIRF